MLARLGSDLRRTNAALILALLLSLLAAWPFLLRPSLPHETDTELHVFRTAELGYTLRAGEIYPRWAPDFYYGYGYPIFNYYAPLTYYLANLLSLTIPGGAVFGVKAVFVLGFLAAGGGAYALAEHNSGSRAGIVAAASYLFAPYVYLIDPHLRGDVPEFLALSLAPFLFWSVAKYQHTPSRLRLILATCSVAAVILSHNLLALILFGMAVLFAVWGAIAPAQSSSSTTLQLLSRAAVPLALGVGLSAFFWLPVALEHDEVQLGNLIGPGHFDFRSHFLEPSDLFALSIPLDLGAVNPAFRFNLGLGQWLLGLLGIGALIGSLRGARRENRSAAGRQGPQALALAFWPISFFFLLLLMTRWSLPLWEAVPLMKFFQFPWRLLGPASLCVALTGSFSVSLLEYNLSRSRLLTLGLLALPLVFTLPIWAPPGWDSFGPTDRLAMLEFELKGLALGTTSTGDFVPTTVDLVPAPNPDLIASYQDGDPIDRVNRHTLPAGTAVEIIRQRPTSDVFAITSDEAFALRLYRFMFAGWRATIDGQPIAIEVAQPEGFITVPVPAGSHTVRVWLGLTPARVVASGVSIASLIALTLIAGRLHVNSEQRHFAGLPEARWVVAGLAAFALLAGISEWAGLFQPRSTGVIAEPAPNQIRAFVQGGIDLIGYDIPDPDVAPGEELAIDLYWKAREPVPANYQVFVHLTSIPEHTWGQSDKLNPGDYPTTRWPMDRYVLDPHTLTIPLGTPPGQYTLRVGLWNHLTGVRQLILTEDGSILGDSIALADEIIVLPANQPPDLRDLPLDLTVDDLFAPNLTLLGAEIEPGLSFDAEMGRLFIILYWHLEDAPSSSYNVAVRLRSAEGIVVASQVGPPADGVYPMAQWHAGDIVRDVHSLWVDRSVPAGEYRVEIALPSSDQPTPDRWVMLARVVRQLP